MNQLGDVKRPIRRCRRVWKIDFKKDPHTREMGVVFGRIPKIKGDRRTDRAVGKAFSINLP